MGEWVGEQQEEMGKCIPDVWVLQVHEYLRGKLCSLYENDCIFDKFECCWGGADR